MAAFVFVCFESLSSLAFTSSQYLSSSILDESLLVPRFILFITSMLSKLFTLLRIVSSFTLDRMFGEVHDAMPFNNEVEKESNGALGKT